MFCIWAKLFVSQSFKDRLSSYPSSLVSCCVWGGGGNHLSAAAAANTAKMETLCGSSDQILNAERSINKTGLACRCTAAVCVCAYVFMITSEILVLPVKAAVPWLWICKTLLNTLLFLPLPRQLLWVQHTLFRFRVLMEGSRRANSPNYWHFKHHPHLHSRRSSSVQQLCFNSQNITANQNERWETARQINRQIRTMRHGKVAIERINHPTAFLIKHL